ncbi:MAG: TetR/AcrR family transcriptional regulator [Microthrixaceae bacterium]
MSPDTRGAAVGDEASVRARLLQVTMALLDSGGEQALRVVDVAEAAGVSMGTIYTHFENRRALVAAVRLEQYRRWMDESLAGIHAVLDGMEHGGDAENAAATVAALGSLIIRPDDPTPRAHRVVRIDAIAASHHEPALAAAMRQMQRELNEAGAELVRRGQALGVVDPSVDPAAVALLLQAVPLGLAVADLDPDSGPTGDAWVELLLRVGAALMGPASS